MADRQRASRGRRRPVVAVVWFAALFSSVALTASACSGSDDSSGGSASTTSSSTTVAATGPGSAGPLPDCVSFDGGAGLLADGAASVEAAFSVTQGQLTFVALRVAGEADPVVVVRVGEGAWQAVDEGSATATGAPLGDAADPTASRASLGAQKAVDCLGRA